ncbi:retropepsin-like aspartic protease family protein [Brevundimonas naejangsanensis]
MIRFDPRSAVVFAAALASGCACIGALMWWEGSAQAYAAVALKEAPSVTRAADGHYWAEATVEGRPMRMLVDTGASVVTLSRADAERLGVRLKAHDFSHTLNTASGQVPAARVLLTSLSVAGVEMTSVEALVIDRDMPAALLGMSFLGRLSAFEARPDGLILRG